MADVNLKKGHKLVFIKIVELFYWIWGYLHLDSGEQVLRWHMHPWGSV